MLSLLTGFTYSLLTFQDIQAVVAIDDVEESITVVEDIIALSRAIALGWVQDKISHFFGAVRIRDIHEAQATAEPSDRKDGVVHLLLWLMAAESPRAIFHRALRHNVIGHRYRVLLVSDVHDPT